jgi:hypothetical protein
MNGEDVPALTADTSLIRFIDHRAVLAAAIAVE